MPVAADIDDVIAFASTDIAEVSYGGIESLFTQMQEWIDGVFAESGIFPPSSNETNAGQRQITNWYAESLLARDTIEGPAAGDSGLVSTSNVINAVVRTAYAVKYAAIEGSITGAQQTAVVTLYNNVWA